MDRVATSASWLSLELVPKRSCGRLGRTGRHDASSSVASVALLRPLPASLPRTCPSRPCRRNPVPKRVLKRRGGDSRILLRKLPSSPRRPAQLRPLAPRQSKGTVSLTLAPSRVRNLPRPCWELLRGFLRKNYTERGGFEPPVPFARHNGLRGVGRSSAHSYRISTPAHCQSGNQLHLAASPLTASA
jgi:hypothetical protein